MYYGIVKTVNPNTPRSPYFADIHQILLKLNNEKSGVNPNNLKLSQCKMVESFSFLLEFSQHSF